MATCVTEKGYKEAEQARAQAMKPVTTAKAIFAAVQAVDGAMRAINAYRRVHDIESQALALEEQEYNYKKGTFYPAEDQFLDEFNTPEVWETREVLAKRYEGRLWPPLASQFAKKINELRCSKPRYCTNSYVKAMQDLELTMATTRTSVQTVANQLAYLEFEAVDERSFERRLRAYGHYKGLISQAAALFGSAASNYSQFGGANLGKATSAIGNIFGLMQDPTGTASMSTPEFNGRSAARAESQASDQGGQGGGQGFQGSNGPSPGLVQAQSRNAVIEAERGATGASGVSNAMALQGASTTMQGGASAKNLGPGGFTNNMVAGTGQNLVRSGRLKLTYPGGTFNLQTEHGGVVDIPSHTWEIDIDKLPLADAAGYESKWELTGPANLPGQGTGTIEYKKPINS